jgi:hypothetical protein
MRAKIVNLFEFPEFKIFSPFEMKVLAQSNFYFALNRAASSISRQ